jgi:hypothetical protein
MVAAVHLLQVKLKFVFVCDCYVRADECMLVVIEVHPEGSEMFVPIPLGIVCIFQCFLYFDVKGAPAVIQMFQDLEGSDIAVRHEEILQLEYYCLSRASLRLWMIPWRKPFLMNNAVQMRSQSSSLHLRLCGGVVLLMDGSYDTGSMGIV